MAADVSSILTTPPLFSGRQGEVMTAYRYELGDKLKDRVTGLVGVATVRSEHLFGCERYWIEPQQIGTDGKPIEGRWIDQDSLELVEAQVIKRQIYRVVSQEEAESTSISMRRAGAQNVAKPSTGPSSR